jgi:hypothetical protein
MPEPLVIVVVVFAVLSVLFLVAAFAAVRRRRWLGSFGTLILAVFFLSLAALAATVSVATRGYRALTHEEVAATVVTEPSGPDRFTATFSFADGRTQAYEIAGNAIYVDAHIVKWHPFANILGLHTAYQLDRVGGRYDRLEDEQTKPRSLFALSTPKPVDIAHLARSLAFLAPIVDTQYGSATFVSARQPAAVELRVSTSGLLFRPVPGGARPVAR